MKSLNIIPYFYMGADAKGILEPYCHDLRQAGGRHNLLHANMLEHYVQISEDREFIYSIQKAMTSFFFSYLHTYHHEAQVFGRKKGLVSLEDKCNLLLTRRRIPEVKDSLGFRIILFGKSSEELVSDCYSVMDMCIDFFIAEGFTPTEAEKKSSTSNFNPDKHPNVFVPKKSLLSPENKIFVKDYILHPKEEGYQSLHVILVDSQGREFEVQIRTYLMDQYAESGPASHIVYKKTKYEDDKKSNTETESKPEASHKINLSKKTDAFLKVDISQIDISKIASEHFIVTGNEEAPYYDKVGILEARVFLQLSNL